MSSLSPTRQLTLLICPRRFASAFLAVSIGSRRTWAGVPQYAVWLILTATTWMQSQYHLQSFAEIFFRAVCVSLWFYFRVCLFSLCIYVSLYGYIWVWICSCISLFWEWHKMLLTCHETSIEWNLFFSSYHALNALYSNYVVPLRHVLVLKRPRQILQIWNLKFQ